MTEKIQFESKEQVKEFVKDVYAWHKDPDSLIRTIIEKGYVKKSELQQKVEDVEKIHDNLDGSKVLRWCKFTHDYVVESMSLIQLFKQKYPEDVEKIHDNLDGSKVLRWCKFTYDYVVESMSLIQLFKQKYPEEFK